MPMDTEIANGQGHSWWTRRLLAADIWIWRFSMDRDIADGYGDCQLTGTQLGIRTLLAVTYTADGYGDCQRTGTLLTHTEMETASENRHC